MRGLVQSAFSTPNDVGAPIRNGSFEIVACNGIARPASPLVPSFEVDVLARGNKARSEV